MGTGLKEMVARVLPLRCKTERKGTKKRLTRPKRYFCIFKNWAARPITRRWINPRFGNVLGFAEEPIRLSRKPKGKKRRAKKKRNIPAMTLQRSQRRRGLLGNGEEPLPSHSAVCSVKSFRWLYVWWGILTECGGRDRVQTKLDALCREKKV